MMPRTHEQMAAMRAWRAYLIDYPLHDGHVRTFKSLTKGIQWKRFDCPACGKEVWPIERKRDSVGHLMRHCGCRAGLHGLRRGRSAKRTEQEKQKAKAVWKRVARIRGAPGFKPVKQQAHVVEWKKNKESQRKQRRASIIGPPWPPKFRDAAERERWRMRNDPRHVIHMRMRVQIRKALEGMKAGRRWESLVGYSVDQLAEHLRKQLPKGYTMQDFFNGRLHIDHIVPKVSFNVMEEAELRACWSLPNLRPLPARDNWSKNAKRTHLL